MKRYVERLTAAAAAAVPAADLISCNFN